MCYTTAERYRIQLAQVDLNDRQIRKKLAYAIAYKGATQTSTGYDMPARLAESIFNIDLSGMEGRILISE